MNLDINQSNVGVSISQSEFRLSYTFLGAKTSVDGKTMVTRRSRPTFPHNSDRQTRDLLIPDKIEPRSLALSVILG